MGIYDVLLAVLPCPSTGLEQEVEIQFKFGEPCMDQYHIGDQLAVGPYGDLWIPNEYRCEECSSNGTVGDDLTESQTAATFHQVLIHLNQGKFLDVLPEEEFKLRYVRDGKPALPAGQFLLMSYVEYGKPLFGDDRQMSLFE